MSLFQLLLVLSLTVPICGGAKPTQEPAVQNEALRRELRGMYAKDQQTRKEGLKAKGAAGYSFEKPPGEATPRLFVVVLVERWKLSQLDAMNRQRLKQIIRDHGWPGKSLVGADGAHGAWLLVQHSDADLAFQKECLALMEAAPPGEVSPVEIAYLTDRVLVNENKKQRYGTQLGKNFEPQPLEDPDNVDNRREEIGLPSMAEYMEAAREGYNQMLKEKASK